MKINAYLAFDGQCEEAFKFYERCLGGRITFMMSNKDSPMADRGDPQWYDKIMHATLAVGNEELMGADAPPGHYKEPRGFCVSIALNETAEAERIFSELAENGATLMPLQETFWAHRFGMLIDRFRIPWMINCTKSA